MIHLSHEELRRRCEPYYDVRPAPIPRPHIPLARRLFAWSVVIGALLLILTLAYVWIPTAGMAWLMVTAGR